MKITRLLMPTFALAAMVFMGTGCKSIPANQSGLRHFNQGDIAQALEKFDDALTANTNYRFARNNRGAANYLEGNYSESAIDYEVAINRRHNYAKARNNRSVLLLDRGDDERAERDLRIAIDNRRKYQDGHLNMARLYLARHEFDLALVELNTAIGYHTDDEEDADWAEAFYLRAMVHHQLGDRQSADLDFERAIQQDPSLAWRTIDPYPAHRVAGLLGE